MEAYDWFMVPSLIIADFLISETQQSIIVNCFSTISNPYESKHRYTLPCNYTNSWIKEGVFH